jgi:uncharacterized protein (TIGR02246 family)
MSFIGVLLCGCGLALRTCDEPNTRSTGQAAATNAAHSPDEQAIRAASAAFVRAYNAGDVKALATLFTDDAECADEHGNLIRGTKSITENFAAKPGGKMEVEIDSIRLLTPDVAKEEGRCTIKPGGSAPPEVSRYTVLYIRKDGKWLQSLVREHAEEALSPHDRLKELEWMLGEWVDEGEGSVILTSCRWSEDQNFLLRRYSVQIQGKIASTGTQRIGWDPVTNSFKSWVFDNQGGYSEGVWSRDGQRWVVKTSGPLRDGKISTETNIITPVNKDMARWKSVDRTVSGIVLPDTPEFVLVRKPPQPQK